MSRNSSTTTLFRVAAVAVAVSVAIFGSPSAAFAAAPVLPVGEFQAPACDGETDVSPQSNPGAVADLLQVFDGDPADPRVSRLEAYNLGYAVPLYDSYGMSDLTPYVHPDGSSTIYDAYPPICATRYVASAGGPVSEWMYCTDYTSHSCADVDEDGFGMYLDKAKVARYLTTATEPTASPGNPRLTDDQEKLIAYLVQHGYPYTGVGSYDWLPPGGIANSETTVQRTALQILVWCVSDYGYDPVGDPDFDATCDASMSPTMQQTLADSIPDIPVLTLAVSSPHAAVAPGATVRVRVESNIFAQPLTVTSAQAVTVCSGPGFFSGDQLSITGTDADIPLTVELCVIAPQSGSASVVVSVIPATTEHIGWNQASTGDPSEPCQVYATFYQDQAVMLTGLSTISTLGGELAATGGIIAWPLILSAFALLGMGAVLLARRRFTVR